MIGTISFVGTQWAKIEILIGLDWFNSVDFESIVWLCWGLEDPMHGCRQV